MSHNLVSPSLAGEVKRNPAAETGVLHEFDEAGLAVLPDGRLAPGTLGKRVGTHGEDLGVINSGLASVRGRPPARTSGRSFLIGVHGSGWEQFEYRLNEGPWTPVAIPWLPSPGSSFREGLLPLNDLPEGDQVLQIREHEEAPVRELQWTIASTPPVILINEVAAINVAQEFAAGFPDWVELINTSDVSVDLGSYEMRDEDNGVLVLPRNTMIAAGERLTIPLITTETSGFALNRDGDILTLIDPLGTVIDTISFGRQIPNHTLGRLPSDANRWGLCHPTPGSANLPAAATGFAAARINEVYAASGLAFDEDFLELINTSGRPLDLTGLALTDDAIAHPNKFTFSPHSFMGPEEFLVLNSSELGFGLEAWFESLSLRDAAGGAVLDRVFWQAQGKRTTYGRFPDGTGPWTVLSLGTPGRPQCKPPDRAHGNDAGSLGEQLAVFSRWRTGRRLDVIELSHFRVGLRRGRLLPRERRSLHWEKHAAGTEPTPDARLPASLHRRGTGRLRRPVTFTPGGRRCRRLSQWRTRLAPAHAGGEPRPL